MTKRYQRAFPGEILSTVLTGFENVVWLGTTSAGTGPDGKEHSLVAVDPGDGRELFRVPAGDLANVTMGIDGQSLYTNNINFQDELAGFATRAGVQAWTPAS